MTRNPRTGRFESAGTRHKCDQQSMFDREAMRERVRRNVDRLFLTKPVSLDMVQSFMGQS